MRAEPRDTEQGTGPRAPRLLAISDSACRGDESLISWLQRVAAAGVDTAQLREKQLTDRQLYEQAREARKTVSSSLRLFVNGRPDIALAAGCEGVHLPAAEQSAAAIRQQFGPHLLLGRSTHSVREVADARRNGFDYVTFGPVFATPSKVRYGPPPGLEGLRRAVEVEIPVIALGGISAADWERLEALGAHGVAGIRAFHDSESLEYFTHYRHQLAGETK